MLTNELAPCLICKQSVPVGYIHTHIGATSITLPRQTGSDTTTETVFADGTKPTLEGKRYDAGKPRVSLLMGYAIEQVMLVGEFGAKKYGDDNYRAGMAVSKYLNAAFRHVFIEFLFKGVDNDAESGLPHLAHAAWNLLAACEQMILKPEFDDRYTTKQKSEGSK